MGEYVGIKILNTVSCVEGFLFVWGLLSRIKKGEERKAKEDNNGNGTNHEVKWGEM